MRTLTVLVAASGCLLLVGCDSKKLTREKAARLIDQYNALPDGLLARHQYLSLMESRNNPVPSADVAVLQRAQQLGWIALAVHPCKVTPKTFFGPSQTVCPVDIRITDAGRNESKNWRQVGVIWQVPIMQHEVVEVTGISEGAPGGALVQYTWHWAPTEYGKELGIKSGVEQTPDQIGMQLFDDGWRVASGT